MSIQFLLILIIFGIPILGILLAGYKEWLKFRAKHQEMGTSAREVEEHLQSLRERLDRTEEERDTLQKRVQNLETIVTSEAWIAQHDDAADLPSPKATKEGELELPADSDPASRDDAERTADIAGRLRKK